MSRYELDVFRLRDALILRSLQSQKHYIISNNRKFEKISHQDICYVYKEQKNSIFVAADALKIPVRKTLSEVYAELDSEEFTYIDRCDIINLSNVEGILDRCVCMAGSKKLVMGAGHLVKINSIHWGNSPITKRSHPVSIQRKEQNQLWTYKIIAIESGTEMFLYFYNINNLRGIRCNVFCGVHDDCRRKGRKWIAYYR